MADRKSFINVRGGFSDTSGVAPCNTEMQLHEFDRRTRTLLSNELFKLLKVLFEDSFEIFRVVNADSGFCEDILSKKVYVQWNRYAK